MWLQGCMHVEAPCVGVMLQPWLCNASQRTRRCMMQVYPAGTVAFAGLRKLVHAQGAEEGCAEIAGELAKEVAARHLVLTGEFLERLLSRLQPLSCPHDALCHCPVQCMAMLTVICSLLVGGCSVHECALYLPRHPKEDILAKTHPLLVLWLTQLRCLSVCALTDRAQTVRASLCLTRWICTDAGFPETEVSAEAAPSTREEDKERKEVDEAERLWWDSSADSQPAANNRCGTSSLHGLHEDNSFLLLCTWTWQGHWRILHCEFCFHIVSFQHWQACSSRWSTKGGSVHHILISTSVRWFRFRGHLVSQADSDLLAGTM